MNGLKEAMNHTQRCAIPMNGRGWALLLCAALCLLQAGCASRMDELLRKLPRVFTGEEEKIGVAPHGPDELVALLGRPDSRKSVGGTSEDWVYRFSDGSVVLRLSFFNPDSKPDQDLPATRAGLSEMTVYDTEGRVKAVPFGPAAWAR